MYVPTTRAWVRVRLTESRLRDLFLVAISHRIYRHGTKYSVGTISGLKDDPECSFLESRVSEGRYARLVQFCTLYSERDRVKFSSGCHSCPKLNHFICHRTLKPISGSCRRLPCPSWHMCYPEHSRLSSRCCRCSPNKSSDVLEVLSVIDARTAILARWLSIEIACIYVTTIIISQW